MTPEQELMWGILSSDVEKLTIEGGKRLSKMRGSKRGTKHFHQKVDELLGLILDVGTDDEIARAAKTLLMSFQLPINPLLLSNFERFHNRVGHLINNTYRSIQPYDIS